MSNPLNRTRREIEEGLIAKAQREPAFRKKLIENPAQAIEAEVGISVPTGVKFLVLEESAETFYLVLPPAGESTEAEAGPTGIVRLLANVAGPMY